MEAIHSGLAVLLTVCSFLLFPLTHLGNNRLCQAIKGVRDSYDALVELLESIEHFLYRLDIYTKITPTVAMTEMLVKILVELLSTLAMATKQVRQGKPSESVFSVTLYYLTRCITENIVKKLFGEKDVKAVLQRLDRLTQDEAKLTATQILDVVYGLVQNLNVITDGEQIYQACRSLGVEYRSFQTAKYRSTVSRMPSVCYWFQRINSVSN